MVQRQEPPIERVVAMSLLLLGPWIALASVLGYRWWLTRQEQERQRRITEKFTGTVQEAIDWHRSQYEAQGMRISPLGHFGVRVRIPLDRRDFGDNPQVANPGAEQEAGGAH